jgi:hypothetical protein
MWFNIEQASLTYGKIREYLLGYISPITSQSQYVFGQMMKLGIFLGGIKLWNSD